MTADELDLIEVEIQCHRITCDACHKRPCECTDGPYRVGCSCCEGEGDGQHPGCPNPAAVLRLVAELRVSRAVIDALPRCYHCDGIAVGEYRGRLDTEPDGMIPGCRTHCPMGYASLALAQALDAYDAATKEGTP